MERLAVSDHILLGGDNLDLALAAHVEQQLTGQQRNYLPDFGRHSPRNADEQKKYFGLLNRISFQ